MPNFDGTGPLKRGTVIGRGQGNCRKSADRYRQLDTIPESPVRSEAPAL
jgi:hypothetical protein